MIGTKMKVERMLDSSKFAIMTHISERKNEIESNKYKSVFQDVSFLVRGEEKVAMTSFFVQTAFTILDEALLFKGKWLLTLAWTYNICLEHLRGSFWRKTGSFSKTQTQRWLLWWIGNKQEATFCH